MTDPCLSIREQDELKILRTDVHEVREINRLRTREELITFWKVRV